VVSVLNKKAFKLPRVEKEKFMQLINAGLSYDRGACLYSFKDCNDIENLMDIITSILNTDVVFLQTCTRCGKDFPCGDCKYGESCTTKNLPFSCVCPTCLRERKNFEEYLKKF
jgi:hypothetical protein